MSETAKPAVGPAPDPTSESSSARMVLTLGLAGLVSGVLIVGAYELTLPAITEHKAQALQAAVLEVVPGSTSMQRLAWADGGLIASADGNEPAVYGAYGEDGRLMGYAIPGAGPGFQDTIRLIYGFDPVKRQVVGLRILESRETPGLGDKIFKDAEFQENFRALAVEPAPVLVGKGKKSAPNEVDAITGATISSRAVVRIIETTNAGWLERLGPEAAPLQAATGLAPSGPSGGK